MEPTRFRRNPDLTIGCLTVDDHFASIYKTQRQDARGQVAVDVAIVEQRLNGGQHRVDLFVKRCFGHGAPVVSLGLRVGA